MALSSGFDSNFLVDSVKRIYPEKAITAFTIGGSKGQDETESVKEDLDKANKSIEQLKKAINEIQRANTPGSDANKAVTSVCPAPTGAWHNKLSLSIPRFARSVNRLFRDRIATAVRAARAKRRAYVKSEAHIPPPLEFSGGCWYNLFSLN